MELSWRNYWPNQKTIGIKCLKVVLNYKIEQNNFFLLHHLKWFIDLQIRANFKWVPCDGKWWYQKSKGIFGNGFASSWNVYFMVMSKNRLLLGVKWWQNQQKWPFWPFLRVCISWASPHSGLKLSMMLVRYLN